jgi:hypothetical protein
MGIQLTKKQTKKDLLGIEVRKNDEIQINTGWLEELILARVGYPEEG